MNYHEGKALYGVESDVATLDATRILGQQKIHCHQKDKHLHMQKKSVSKESYAPLDFSN